MDQRKQAQVLECRRVYSGKLLEIDLERLRLPNGAETTLEIIRHPGAAAVVPLRPDGTVVMIRQYRSAAGGYIFEIPAGKLDPGEGPETCAHRELQEEVGLRTGKLHPLGPIHTTPGFTDERIWLYVATDLAPVPQMLEEDEVIEVVEMSLHEALEKVVNGDITDSKTICGLLRTDQERRAGRL
ncbi:MAG: ADP-ribose pyrophosphatase [Planctomycetes bacterium]|nr:ADP-ribose pyrophosphatase [Planctomycetota bacterium]